MNCNLIQHQSIVPVPVRRVVRARRLNITDEMILEKTAKHFNISRGQITGIRKDRIIYEGRAVVAYILRNELGWPWSSVAERINRDHSSAINMCKNVDYWLTHRGFLSFNMKFGRVKKSLRLK